MTRLSKSDGIRRARALRQTLLKIADDLQHPGPVQDRTVQMASRAFEEVRGLERVLRQLRERAEQQLPEEEEE